MMSETEIIEYYSETKNNEDYTADGIPTIKKQLEDSKKTTRQLMLESYSMEELSNEIKRRNTLL